MRPVSVHGLAARVAVVEEGAITDADEEREFPGGGSSRRPCAHALPCRATARGEPFSVWATFTFNFQLRPPPMRIIRHHPAGPAYAALQPNGSAARSRATSAAISA